MCLYALPHPSTNCEPWPTVLDTRNEPGEASAGPLNHAVAFIGPIGMN